MLDIDNKVGTSSISIRDFIEKFKEFHFILFPSTTHLRTKDENNLPIEKYRVIFPLNPYQYQNFNSVEQHQRLYESIKDQFP